MALPRVAYSKPHLTYEKQADLLASRGLTIDSRPHALLQLEQIGYYRLSGYLYPFRQLVAGNQPQYDSEYRQSTFVAGSRFSDAVQLYWFDMGLRSLAFAAVGSLELELRARIAYSLGALDPFGYESPGPIDTSTTKRLKNFARWDSSATKSVRQSKRTDYMKHFTAKYTQQTPPIWMLVETLDFGGLTSLYSVMNQSLQSQLSSGFGVSQGSLFEDWLQNLRDVRNTAAHHSRLWNARLNFSIGSANHIHPDLAHLQPLPGYKVYASLALLQYFFRAAGIQPQFAAQVKSHIAKFPNPQNGAVSIQKDMGFPAGWTALALWA